MVTRQSIALLRTRTGASQQDVADAVGVSRGAIARVEVGSLGLSDKLAEGIAKVFGLTVDDLLAYVEGRASLSETAAKMPETTKPKQLASESEVQALNAAVTVNGYILDGLKRTNATLDALDTVRAWVSALGPVASISRILTELPPETASAVIDAIFAEAARQDSRRAPAGIALLRVLSQQMRLLTEPNAEH